jgi:aspartate ammonia-lyase
LYKSISHLTHACRTLREHCVVGIEPNRELLARRVLESVTLVTALNPIIGYEKSARIAKEAIATGAPIGEVAQKLGIMSREELESLLVPQTLTRPLRAGRRNAKKLSP